MAAGTLSVSAVLSTEIKNEGYLVRGARGLPARGDPKYDSAPRVIEGRWRGWRGGELLGEFVVTLLCAFLFSSTYVGEIVN